MRRRRIKFHRNFLRLPQRQESGTHRRGGGWLRRSARPACGAFSRRISGRTARNLFLRSTGQGWTDCDHSLDLGGARLSFDWTGTCDAQGFRTRPIYAGIGCRGVEGYYRAGADRRHYSGAGVGARGGGSDQARAENEEVRDSYRECLGARRQGCRHSAGEPEVGLIPGQISVMPFHFDSKPTLVAYVTCGDPDLATTREIVLAAIDAGAGIIELGVPFSDPLADGPVIQRASERALKHGTSLKQVLKLAAEIREHSQSVGLIVFSYLNPILQMGMSKFCKVARHAGLDGVLITDLPVEESAEYLREARKNDLVTVFLVAPTSTDARLQRIVEVSTGFVYAISRTGVTGARQQMPEDASGLVKRLRRFTKLPVAVGFGISTAEQFSSVGKFADAAVVGSAIVQTIERNPGREPAAVAEFVRQLTAVSSQLSAKRN